MEYLINKVNESDIVKQQKDNPDVDVFTGLPFEQKDIAEQLYDAYIMSIPDEEQKAQVQAYVDGQKAKGEKLEITDDMLAAYVMTLPEEQQATVGSYLQQMREAGLSANDIINRYSAQMITS